MTCEKSEFLKADGTRRVVITGMGAISPAGTGVDALWNAVYSGKQCIAPITRFDASGFAGSLAAEVPNFDAAACGMSKKEARRFALFVQYAIAASEEAWARRASGHGDRRRLRAAGMCVGSGIGGLEEFQRGCDTLSQKGPKRVNPLFIPTMIENMAAGNLSIRFGLKADCLSIVTACATGTHCVGEAYRLIRHGYADMALAGGSEESISPICLAGFGNLGATSKSTDPTAGIDAVRRESRRFCSWRGCGRIGARIA